MTETSRRTLLRASALAVLAAPFVTMRPASAAQSNDLYARERFSKLKNATFRLADSSGTWQVTLGQVYDLPGAPAGDRRRFGLTFHAATTGPVQGSYTLSRNGFTPTPLFVVPSDAQRRTYEAVINRT